MPSRPTTGGRNTVPENYFIIAFGDIEGANSKISANTVFDRLFDAGRWYTPRISRTLTVGGYVLFYQKVEGFRGLAKISAISNDAADAPFGSDHYFAFSQSLSLTEMERFATSIDPRPIMDVLDFVTNKKYWGHAFRSTPRRISKKDYLAILRLRSRER